MKRRRWWHNTLIWLNAASGATAFAMTAFGMVDGSLPLPKWAMLLIGSTVAAMNVGLHFIITDPDVMHQIQKDDDDGRPT